MFFKQLYEPRLAQYSYIIGCQDTGEALVVDPLRDFAPYLRITEQENLRVTHVTETHIHADFLSGAQALARATDAELLLSDEGDDEWRYAFPHQGLKHGDQFQVGHVRIEVRHTPGHTPEHISFLIFDPAAGEAPRALLSGDFLFVGDVGRPDLLELVGDGRERTRQMARQLFTSLQHIRQLPDHVLLWPGHGSGSACGKALSAVPVSSIGYEKRTNWALLQSDEEAFVLELLSEQPEIPRYFRNMKLWNRSGEKSGQSAIPRPPRLSVQQLQHLQTQGGIVVDARDKMAFAEGHIPGSINIPGFELFTTWAGWLLDYDTPFALVAPEARSADLVTALYRIGLDQIVGLFPNIDHWAQMGLPLARLPLLSARELAAAQAQRQVVPVDVREPHELHGGHIPGAISAPAGRLIEGTTEPDTARKLVFYCQKGDRSAMVASYLMSQGFENVMSLREGFAGWRAAGLEPAIPEPGQGFEKIDVLTAHQRFNQQNAALIDVRDPEQFARGHVPGAQNVPLEDFVEEDVIAGLRQKGPLLLICNTGNLSGMAAEWLLEEGFEQLANVEGGVIAWQLHHLPWER